MLAANVTTPATRTTPSAHYPSQLPVNAAATLATYQASPCEKPRTSTLTKQKPTDATRSLIADTARTMPHTLRAVDRNSEVLAALKMLSGFDDDTARDCTRTINRLRSVLTQIYPSLERIFAGSTLTRSPVLDLLIHYKSPTGLKKAGRSRVLTWLSRRTHHNPDILVDNIFTALAAQTVTVPGTQ